VADLGITSFSHELLGHLDVALEKQGLRRVAEPNAASLALKAMPSAEGPLVLSLVRTDGSVYWTSGETADAASLAIEISAMAERFLGQRHSP
jgi:hypothetical protein